METNPWWRDVLMSTRHGCTGRQARLPTQGGCCCRRVWKWRRATVTDIDLAAGERRLISNAAGWLVFEPDGQNAIEVVWVAAGQNDFPRLVNAALHYAADNEINEVYFKISETGWTGETLRREGFAVSTITVYAKPVLH